MAEALPSTEMESSLPENIFDDDFDFEFNCVIDHQKAKGTEEGEDNSVISNKVDQDEGKGDGDSLQNNLSGELADSDIDEVLAESTEFLLCGKKVIIKPDFFFLDARTSSGGRNSVSGESMTYDPTPPSRNQVIGSTPEYLEHLKSQPEKILPLVPIFTQEELNKPSNMYWNYPRAVMDYEMIEKWMTPIVPNGAVKKLICQEGRDEKLVAGDNVLINYYIYVEGCPYCVQSNKRLRKPHSFVLGRKRAGIPVIDLGTLSMRVKEVAAFLATPEYGFGENGTGEPWIPPNKRVLCIIEVLSRLASPLDSSSIINLVPAERKLLRFEEIYEFAMKRKIDANKDYANEKNARALRKYLQVATCLNDAVPKTKAQQDKKLELLHTIFNSIANCGHRTGQRNIVVEFCEKAIELPISEEDKARDYYKCARALFYLHKYKKAKIYLDKALPLLVGSDVEQDVKILLEYVKGAISTSEKGTSEKGRRSSYSGSTSYSSSPSESATGNGKGKKKRSASLCGSFLMRRFSESSSK